MKVAITGATGFIGRRIVHALLARGDEVVAFSRSNAELPGARIVRAELEHAGVWGDELAGCDAVINLAGEPIAGKRWDARQKQLLRDSRIETTRNLVEAMAKLDQKPSALISASGVDYYPFAHTTVGDFDDDEVTEADPPGEDFLARLCAAWEAEAREAEKLGVRVATMRTGVVLGEGGALAKMETPFKLFAGGRIGNGKQWMAWIHIADVADVYVHACSNERYRGPINLVTESVRNADFAKLLGAVMHRPSWLPVPAFALRLAVGELSETLLNGRRVVPKRLRELGFTWRHPELDEALRSTR